MTLQYRIGSHKDLNQLKKLSIETWSQYDDQLTPENRENLTKTIQDDQTYLDLLDNSTCFVCEINDHQIIAMAFLVPSGNPTEIYEAHWSYIRFVTVHPDFTGKGIGKEITQKCMDLAKETGEKYIALHTSEMMLAARHIYQSLGFKILKEIPKRLGKRYWLYVYEIIIP